MSIMSERIALMTVAVVIARLLLMDPVALPTLVQCSRARVSLSPESTYSKVPHQVKQSVYVIRKWHKGLTVKLKKGSEGQRETKWGS